MKIKFTSDFIRRASACKTHTTVVFKKIPAKYQGSRAGEKDIVIRALSLIVDYAFHNIGVAPASDRDSIIKHETGYLQRVKDAREKLRVLYLSVDGTKRNEIKGRYNAALALFHQFESHLADML